MKPESDHHAEIALKTDTGGAFSCAGSLADSLAGACQAACATERTSALCVNVSWRPLSIRS